MRTNHARVLLSQHLRVMCALGLDKWMCVGDYRDSLDGTIVARCERPLLEGPLVEEQCADQPVLSSAAMIDARPSGTRMGAEQFQGARRLHGAPFARNSSLMTSRLDADRRTRLRTEN
jgi:hypothetical protein